MGKRLGVAIGAGRREERVRESSECIICTMKLSETYMNRLLKRKIRNFQSQDRELPS